MPYPHAPEPYISRPQAESLVDFFDVALTQPRDHPLVFRDHPLVFNISGMAGTGKTTLLKHLITQFDDQAEILAFSFREAIHGLTGEASLNLMHLLYEQVSEVLRQKTDREFSSFSKLYEQYCSTIKKLINEAPNKKATTDVERTQVKQGLKQVAKALPIAASFSGLGPVVTGIGALSQVATDQNIDTAVDGSIALLSGKEWLQQWLQQHNATKRDQALQQLVLNPVQRLTQAFVADLIAHADQKPIIICLDTFEKAPLEIDRWLCYYLLSQVELNKHPIRIVISGQQRLTQKEEWRKLQQDCDLIFEQILERFNGEETQAYLEEIHWTSADNIQKIIQITGGLPYYLNWIRKKFQKGEEIDLSQGNQAVSDLLFQGITQEQRIVVQLIACCRWFDRALIRKLIRQGELLDEAAISQDYDWFEWLKPQHYVQQIQGKYQFDDVARNVFQTLLQQEDEEHFRNAHLALAKHYQHRANQMIAPNSSEPTRYNNPDWCEAITEYLYHLLLSEQSDRYAEFLNYFFTSHYLKTNEVVTNAFVALTSEHELLSKSTQVYFDNIHSLFNSFLSEVLGLKISQLIDFVKQRSLSKTQDPEHIKKMEGASKALGDYLESELSNTLVKCSNYINPLEGLGKYTFLLYRSQVVSIPEAKNWLKRATDEANKIANITFPDFSSDIYHKLGNSYSEIKDFEDAIASWDKALQFKPDLDQAWYNRGIALGNLGQFEDAISSYDKALEFKPEDDQAWYNRGIALGNLGQFEDAISSYDKALEFKPEDDQAWNNRGVALGNLGRFDDAISSYDKALEFKPEDDQAWNNRGVALGNLGRFDDAISSYDKALEFKPEDDQAWNNRGVALGNLGQFEDAIASWDKALQFKPENDQAWYNRGIALGNLGQFEDAIASWDKALQFKPDKDIAWTNRGVALGELGRFDDEIASYDKALQFKPDQDEAWYNRGVALGNLGQFEDEIASYDKALQFKPDKDGAWYNRGIALRKLGRFEDAIASYDKALELKPDNDTAWYNRGIALRKLGRFEDAIASYDNALKFKPDYVDAWNNRGVALGNLGRYEDEIASYDKALQFKPDDEDTWTNRGVALHQLGRYEDAIASYDNALKFKPDDEDTWTNRGVALHQLGRYEDAIASYDNALKFKPDYDNAWYNRGVALGNLGRFEDAIASYDKALEFKPDKDQAWYNRGFALGNLGRFEDAIASYDKALEFKPDKDQAWYNRGIALRKLGRFEDAIASYDKALEFKPDNDAAWYNKACCYALQANPEAAVKNLSRAIALAPDINREMAKTDSDFDSIRDNEAFQALLT